MAAAVELVRSLLRQVRVPSQGDRIYKDECAYSFDSPYSPEGIFLNMSSFIAYGREHVERDHARTGQRVYLNLRKAAIEQPAAAEAAPANPPEKKPRVLGIGVEGGFAADATATKYEDVVSLVVLPEWARIPLPEPELPDLVDMAYKAVMSAQSAFRRDEVVAWVADQQIPVSAHAESLVQLNNGVRIPESGWKCARCDLRENLWLNLTDGTLLCGRRNWDGTGGNGHALEHYNETKYPLCVKLATIAADGTADVYSYAEDSMVIDPLLRQHLLHFGIDMNKMSKTEKTIAELEVDANVALEFSAIQESGRTLERVYGGGHTGLANLGNSCYLASVIQVLFHTAPFCTRYADAYAAIIDGAPADPSNDLTVQLAKLAHGLWSGRYSADRASELGPDGAPAPRAFKTLIGRGHHEFATGRQQDASEFFQHLFSCIERADRAASASATISATRPFVFSVIERLECLQSGAVRYRERPDNLLGVPVVLEAALNSEQVEAYRARHAALLARTDVPAAADMEPPVKPLVPLVACLRAFAASNIIDGFMSPVTKQRGAAAVTMRLKTFPDYLFVQVQKFAYGEDGSPKKLDVRIDAPDEIDLEFLRGHGMRPEEVALPEGDDDSSGNGNKAAKAAAAPAVNEALVESLAAMGFSRNACIRAARATPGQDAEAAANWLFAHMEDPDINDDIVDESASATGASSQQMPQPDEEIVAMIMSMGFARHHVIRALRETGNDGDRAAEWLFSRADSLDAEDVAATAPPLEGASSQAEQQQAGGQPAAGFVDGEPKYRLVAFISHMGTSTASGHYVCHIREGDRWILFNDGYVAVSQEPPRELAYMYLYQRMP